MTSPVLELRVAVTTDDYEKLVAFYEVGMGLDPAQLWTTGEARATLFEFGRGTLEVFNEQQAALVDDIEARQRISGQIRFAFQVPDLQAAIKRLVDWGAVLIHEPVVTPWGDHNARLQSPDGLQVTLFQVHEES